MDTFEKLDEIFNESLCVTNEPNKTDAPHPFFRNGCYKQKSQSTLQGNLMFEIELIFESILINILYVFIEQRRQEFLENQKT